MKVDRLTDHISELEAKHTLRWTTTQPTEQGWYWTRWEGGRVYITLVDWHDLVRMHPNNPREWAGPIPEPRDRAYERQSDS